jgi:hypothetical protein
MRHFIVLFILVSCTSNQSIKRRDLDHLYIGGAQEQYFLADLPTWSNFSTISKCRISTPVKYLNFKNLYRSYGLSYEKLVQFQYMFNKRIQSYKKESGRSDIILQDEAYIFFNVQEQILGGAKEFLKPTFKKINVFWIDPALNNSKLKASLIKNLKSKEGLSGHPVFLSRCLDGVAIEKFIKKNKLDTLGIKYLPTSMFTPYNAFMRLGFKYELDIGQVLKDKDITFYGPSVPEYITGKMIIKKY